MRYSLLSRFQGALVGAALGEILGVCCRVRQRQRSADSWLRVDHWGFAAAQELLPLGWGQVVVDGSGQLTQTNRWDLEKLTNRLDLNSKDYRSGGLAIATLPLTLYFHDDIDQLQTQIQQAIAGWMSDAIPDPELLSSVLIVSYGMALALREEFDPTRLIPDLIADLGTQALTPIVNQMLHQVQTLVEERTSLAIATSQLARSYLPHHPELFDLSIVLTSVLTVPDDFRLSLLQVVQVSRQPQTACAIAGAILGTYNSLAGLPVGWRRKLNAYPDGSSPLVHLWTVASEAELLLLAERLLSSWAGLYNPAQADGDINTPLTIAAPDVIRPW